jgi:hypothetical protein
MIAVLRGMELVLRGTLLALLLFTCVLYLSLYRSYDFGFYIREGNLTSPILKRGSSFSERDFFRRPTAITGRTFYLCRSYSSTFFNESREL